MKTIKHIIPFAVAAAVLFSCGSGAGTDDKSGRPETELGRDTLGQNRQNNTESDRKFAMDAAEGGLYEVMMGELAQMNAQDPKVKDLGRMMVEDHGKANEELKMLAQKKDIQLPAGLGDEKQQTYNRMAAMKGKDFDKAYADLMVQDHQKDIALFRQEADSGQDPDLKSWASGKLPVLEHHLSMAQELQTKYNGQGGK